MTTGKPGQMYVDGAYLYIFGSDGNRYRYTGTSVSTESLAKPGSVWVESGYFYYVDTNHYKRRLPRSQSSQITSAIKGSTWITTVVNFIDDNHYLIYADQNSSTYGDHSDVPATQRYSDIPLHNDASYYDGGFSQHSDAPHSDSSTYGDHTDNPVAV